MTHSDNFSHAIPDPMTGKVALVTGGAKRIGRAIALQLARAGMDVAITFRTSQDHANQTVQQIQQLGRQALAIQADLTQPEDAAHRIHDAVTSRFERLDALVNNAGIYAPTPFQTVTPDDLQRYMLINACAPLMLIQKFTSLLSARYHPDDPARTGRIVNLIDTHVTGQPHKGHVAYNTSKAALKEITMTAAAELAPRITVNALAPGIVICKEPPPHDEPHSCVDRVPLKRAGTPQEIAAAVLFLVRDASYCTGQILRLDGGRVMA